MHWTLEERLARCGWREPYRFGGLPRRALQRLALKGKGVGDSSAGAAAIWKRQDGFHSALVRDLEDGGLREGMHFNMALPRLQAAEVWRLGE